MIQLLGVDADLILVAALVFVAIVVALLSRIGLLPKKSLPYVGAALLAAIGWAVFRNWGAKAEKKVLDQHRDDLRKLEPPLDAARTAFAGREEALRAADAEIARHEEALKRRALRAQAKPADRPTVDQMSAQEVLDEFRKAFP
jgi:hypothetical protein